MWPLDGQNSSNKGLAHLLYDFAWVHVQGETSFNVDTHRNWFRPCELKLEMPVMILRRKL